MRSFGGYSRKRQPSRGLPSIPEIPGAVQSLSIPAPYLLHMAGCRPLSHQEERRLLPGGIWNPEPRQAPCGDQVSWNAQSPSNWWCRVRGQAEF